MNEAPTATARASYERCCQTRDFPSFYADFLARCPEARPMFEGTDIKLQEKRLRHAIGLLLIYGSEPTAQPSVLSRLAVRHSRADLNVDPGLYDQFVESLIRTVERHDPEFSPDVERAWRAAITPGIAYMKAAYAAPPGEAGASAS